MTSHPMSLRLEDHRLCQGQVSAIFSRLLNNTPSLSVICALASTSNPPLSMGQFVPFPPSISPVWKYFRMTLAPQTLGIASVQCPIPFTCNNPAPGNNAAAPTAFLNGVTGSSVWLANRIGCAVVAPYGPAKRHFGRKAYPLQARRMLDHQLPKVGLCSFSMAT